MATIRPDTKVIDLVKHDALMNDLTQPEFAVYLRLVALSAKQSRRALRVRNVDLHANPRTAQRALRGLCDLNMVRVTLDAVDNSRTVELPVMAIDIVTMVLSIGIVALVMRKRTKGCDLIGFHLPLMVRQRDNRRRKATWS